MMVTVGSCQHGKQLNADIAHASNTELCSFQNRRTKYSKDGNSKAVEALINSTPFVPLPSSQQNRESIIFLFPERKALIARSDKNGSVLVAFNQSTTSCFPVPDKSSYFLQFPFSVSVTTHCLLSQPHSLPSYVPFVTRPPCQVKLM